MSACLTYLNLYDTDSNACYWLKFHILHHHSIYDYESVVRVLNNDITGNNENFKRNKEDHHRLSRILLAITEVALTQCA